MKTSILKYFLALFPATLFLYACQQDELPDPLDTQLERRLREATRVLLPLHGRPGTDYVFIARARTVTRAWPALLDDMESALISLARRKGGPTGPADARRHRPDKDETAHG